MGPNLLELSLFNGNIEYQSLIEYNVPENIQNDTDAVDQWFDDNFKFNPNQTDFWFVRHPINDENITGLPVSLQSFFNAIDFSDDPCSDSYVVTESFCAPRKLGDGRCDIICTWSAIYDDACDTDYGDCLQLCFAPELSSCSLDLLGNPGCDDECWNEYCGYYDIGGTFKEPPVVDLTHCSWPRSSNGSDALNTLNCSDSVSIFLDPNIPTDRYFGVADEPYGVCQEEWIGDGWCDDQCRTEECSDDGGDCANGEGCGAICSLMYSVWTFAFGDGQYGVNHSYACSNLWDMAMALSQSSDDWTANCSESLDIVDFNNDSWINFREFAVLGTGTTTGAIWKYGVNCSDCIGMENYNPYFG